MPGTFAPPHMQPTLSLFTPSHAEACRSLYEPYVLHTPVTFDYEVPSQQAWLHKTETITAEYPWLLLHHGQQLLGYAYAARFRAKVAYQWSPESTIYLAADACGKGFGRVLYDTLFSLLRLQGYKNVYAGVTIPNPASEKLHLACGFTDVGIYRNVGYKHGLWHHTRWYCLVLGEHLPDPTVPRPFPSVEANEVTPILAIANNRLNPG